MFDVDAVGRWICMVLICFSPSFAPHPTFPNDPGIPLSLHFSLSPPLSLCICPIFSRLYELETLIMTVSWILKSSPSICVHMRNALDSCFAAWTETMTVSFCQLHSITRISVILLLFTVYSITACINISRFHFNWLQWYLIVSVLFNNNTGQNLSYC